MFMNKPKPADDYQDRLRGYERDKQQLRATMGHLSAAEFTKALKALADKWRI